MRRRDFLRSATTATGGVLLAAPSLEALISRAAAGGDAAADLRRLRAGLGEGGYGELVEAGPELALPRDFRYVRFGVEGSPMTDGIPTPRAHDGMAAFPLPGGHVRLVRNHEDRTPAVRSVAVGDPSTAYDPLGAGGTTSLDIRVTTDGERQLVAARLTLNGTIVNCAGGPTPWGSWLTCEETTRGPESGWRRPHGYVFEVPAAAEAPVPATPLRAMGRFVHEAVAVDPATGTVYQTEDTVTAGFYRYVPDVPGQLAEGGRLEMLAVEGSPRYGTSTGQEVGRPLPVRWVPIREPDPPEAGRDPAAVFTRGLEAGGARFSRLEGCWWGDGAVYFHATSGGDERLGQVWQYRPDREEPDGGTLLLVFESPDPGILDSPDNITVSPRGGLVICEDAAGGRQSMLRGLTRDGKIFDFGRNILNGREFAGACFAPDGETLFVNVQGDTWPGGRGHPGMTFAIWGPWEHGAL